MARVSMDCWSHQLEQERHYACFALAWDGWQPGKLRSRFVTKFNRQFAQLLFYTNFHFNLDVWSRD